jgi:hypothetical protein
MFDTAAEYRDYSRAATTPSLSQAWPDQWVDWGGHTVTVDPVGNKQWIHDSHDGHARTEARGRKYDKQLVNELVNWEKTHEPNPVQYYTPTISGDKYNPVMTDQVWGCRSWRGVLRDSSNFGKLPSITALIHENKLPDKDRGQIEEEMREQNRRRATRLYTYDNKLPRQAPADVQYTTRAEQPAVSPGLWTHDEGGNFYPAAAPAPVNEFGYAVWTNPDWQSSAARRHMVNAGL